LNIEITPPTSPENEDFEALKLGLNSFNEAVIGTQKKEVVSSFLKEPSGLVLGGVLGEIKWGWLYVEGLWVDDSLRGHGWGKELLKTLEQYACSKGICNYRLETTSFQALGFYHKMGYSVYGELPEMPPGHTSYFLKKQAM